MTKFEVIEALISLFAPFDNFVVATDTEEDLVLVLNADQLYINQRGSEEVVSVEDLTPDAVDLLLKELQEYALQNIDECPAELYSLMKPFHRGASS